MQILFLYSEVMGYTEACLKTFSDLYSHVRVEVIMWDENKKTPFVPQNYGNITYRKRSDFTKETLLSFSKNLDPKLLYISGRMDSAYLYVAKYFRKKGIKTISGFDSQWHGSWKNWVTSALSRLLYKRYFSHIWTPGKPQAYYARKLGYKEDNIVKNLLSADRATFSAVYDKRKELQSFDKTLLFVGRFAEVKGLHLLTEAFFALPKEKRKGWRLKLIGNGPLKDSLPQNESVQIIDFLHPQELRKEIISDAIFVLPSTSEPWGVVVHEFAFAGFPIICSNKCGARTAFVEDGENGYIFENGNAESLKEKLSLALDLDNLALQSMSKKSHDLSKKITPEIWSQTLMRLVDKS